MPRRLLVALAVVAAAIGGTLDPATAAPPSATSRPGPAVGATLDQAVAAAGSARAIVTYRRAPGLQAAGASRRVLLGGRAVARTVTRADLASLRHDANVAAVVLDDERGVAAFPAAGWEHEAAHLDSPPLGDAADGRGQVVAVVDTGVLAGHAYFTDEGSGPSRVLPGACFATSASGGGACPNGQPTQLGGGAEPCIGSPDCSHGTHVAGIVAGLDTAQSLRGVAPGATILPIRVFNVTGGHAEAFDSDVLAALYYIYEHRHDFNLAAVNLSLGGGHSTGACDADPSMGLYVDVIGRLRAAGIATTIAAGNDGSASSVAFPSCVSSAVTVSASSGVDGLPDDETVAAFSDRLTGVTDFIAPGVRIKSSVVDSSNAAFAFDNGTSMAAPMIAGAFAAVRAAKTIPHNLAGFTAIYNGLLARADAISDGIRTFPRPDIVLAIADTVVPADTNEPDDPPPITGRFVPVTPERLVDTRQTPGQRVPAGELRFFDFDDSGVLPAGASAAALNVTVVKPGSAGFLTVFPCTTGAGPVITPDTSNVNFGVGTDVANLVVVGVSAAGQVCFEGTADMDVIVDLMGWYGAAGAGALHAITPERALDTRPVGRPAAGSVVTVPLAGRFGIPGDAGAVVLNVTATDADEAGFAKVFPCAGTPPDTSNVNFLRGRAVPNQVLVGLAGGAVCITVDKPANIIVDVSGYYAPPPDGTGRFVAITPGRLVDTRQTGVKPAARTVVAVPAIGRAGVPADATAVALNVTVDSPGGLGFLTVFPCAAATPDVSNLNYVAGLTVAASVTVGVGQSGAVCVYTEASAHVVVDVTGYYGP